MSWFKRSAGVALALLVFAVGCGDDDDSSSGAGGGGGGGDKPEVAYFAVQTPYVEAQLQEVKRVIGDAGGSVQVFYSNFNPAQQFRQMQDAIASGKFNAFIVQPLDGAGMVPAVKQAVAKGIEVASVSSFLGTRQDTTAVQVEGMAASVLDPTVKRGQWLGGLITKACEGLSPCKVVLEPGDARLPAEKLADEETKRVLAKTPGINVAAIVSNGLQPATAQKATQDVLQAHPDVNVISTHGDTAVPGIITALRQAGKKVGTDPGEVRVIGLGGTAAAVKGIRDGSWFGSVLSLPADEGRLVAEAIVKAVRGELDQPVEVSASEASGIEPELTRETLPADFKPQYAG
jgi:ribose transport system substrate-binding protein